MTVNKAYKVRLYPNQAQEKELLHILGATRYVYNFFLAARKGYYKESGKSLSFLQTSRDLTVLRKSVHWLADVQLQPLNQSLRRLDTSYLAFFRHKKGFPKFKSKKDNRQSFQKANAWKVEGSKIKIQEGLSVSFRGNLGTGNYGTLVVSYESTGKWFASVKVKVDVRQPRRYTKPIGIDVGLKTLATLSNGQQFANTQPQKTAQKRLGRAQRVLARRVKGSNRREKARVEIARAYEKIRNVHANHLHQVSAAITSKNHAVIAVEDLNVSGMMRNRKLARALGDAGLRELLRQIKYKQEWKGGQFVEIDRYFPSSKLCSACGFLSETMPLQVRKWKCGGCGRTHDRDVNAAKNILQEALTHRERGATVNPSRVVALKRGGQETRPYEKSM